MLGKLQPIGTKLTPDDAEPIVAKLSTSFPFNLSRQTRATRYMFTLAKISHRITRLYIFQWTGGVTARLIDQRGNEGRPGRMRGHVRGLLVFCTTLWAIAYVEELIWDRALWHDRGWLFGRDTLRSDNGSLLKLVVRRKLSKT